VTPLDFGACVTRLEALAVATVALPGAFSIALAIAPRRALRALAFGGAVSTAGVGAALSVTVLLDPTRRALGDWIVVDAAGGILVATIVAVGLGSVIVSPAYLRNAPTSVVRSSRADRTYWAVLFAFWAVLLAVPLAGNLGAAWVLVEATTATSALLVGFSGRSRALEAGWKYLILTSLGLGVALLGIVVLAAAGTVGGLDALAWTSLAESHLDHGTTLVAYVLLLAGLAAKAGWAPVHNWLPDAHSEAPPPVSALLSAALLPAVALIAWRSQLALAPSLGEQTSRSVLVVFGLASLAVAVPFLWRGLPWKRLLAYSSLEHMGVIALGIGFGSPLALAGVAVHVAGHAIAKALGFYAAGPLLLHEPRAAEHPATGIVRTEPRLAVSLGVSLGALAALPPSPLFVSEVLIVAGGFSAGRPWAAGAAAVLLSLGFLGLAHALIETLMGKSRDRQRLTTDTLRSITTICVVSVVALLALTGVGLALPGSELVTALVRGLA
jgi:hydrogenase-4 component F